MAAKCKIGKRKEKIRALLKQIARMKWKMRSVAKHTLCIRIT